MSTRVHLLQAGMVSRFLTLFFYSRPMDILASNKPVLAFLRTAICCVMGLFALAFAQSAQAQTVTRYTNTTDSATNGINETATPCTNPFLRTFVVGTSYTVSNVDIGVLMSHTYRGDILIYLRSPSGTRIQLARGDGAAADNFNILFDDSAASSITGHTANDTAASGTAVGAGAYPYSYQRTFSPFAALSAFNGQNAAGTWTLEICDRYGGDSGTFFQADLYLTSAPASGADLSMTKSVSNSAPATGATVSYTLSVTNAATSPLTANSVVVRDILPAGFAFVSATGTGTYNSATGDWSVGTIAPGQTRTMTITGTVTATAGALITNIAQVWSSSVPDTDSTPGNNVPGEDDYATASFTVAGTRVAGTPPTLVCPNSSVMFDWDTISWTAGNTSGTYALGSLGNINLSMTNPGTWLNNAALGGQSPSNQNIVHGGTFQFALFQLVDLPNQSSEAVTTITLPANMHGAQFRIIDVDYTAGQFADRIQVSGELDGAVVTPTLTNGIANYVIGNQAFGDGNSNNDQADGTITVTFPTPVDRIIIRYGNHGLAPADPGQQGIAIHDMIFCNPYTELAATKVSAVITDPVNGTTNPKFIPGALVEYTIGVSNTGVSPTDTGTISIVDTVPADTKFCIASISGAGPVRFIDGSPASGLTYSYTSLASATDNLQFSNNGGASWTYTPVADADGCDPAVTHVRVTPSGAFAQGGAFSLRMRFRVL